MTKVKRLMIVPVFLICGCAGMLSSALLPNAPEKTQFKLESPECRSSDLGGKLSLFLSDIDTSSFVDSSRIIFSEKTNTRAAYKLAEWVEPPPRALERMLVRKLQCDGLFRSIERRSSMVRTDYQLSIHLIDFFYNAVTTPGYVQIEAEAELVNLTTRNAVSRKTLIITENITAVEMENTIHAFQKASEKFASETATWLRETLKK